MAQVQGYVSRIYYEPCIKQCYRFLLGVFSNHENNLMNIEIQGVQMFVLAVIKRYGLAQKF